MKKWPYEHSTMCYDGPGPWTGQQIWTHNENHVTDIIDSSVPSMARIHVFKVGIGLYLM